MLKILKKSYPQKLNNEYMRKKQFSFFIALILCTTLFSQKNDTAKIVKNINPEIVEIDLSKLTFSIDTTTFNLNLIKFKPDTIKKVEFLSIKKSLLDSLLIPYYNIHIDSIKNDTLIKADFKSKYRVNIDDITNDTIYVPIPKINKFLAINKKLSIDALTIFNPIKEVEIDTTKFAEDPIWWENSNSFGLDISEAAFVNWNSGGNNSVSGLVKISLERSYKKLHLLWHNEIFVRYGLNQQEGRELRKTDDILQVNSTFGYRKDTISNWYYSVKFNFNTQFTEGFKYPDISNPISNFFAPAYVFLGAGTQYELKKNNFSIYLSPITLKSTFVLDEALSNDQAFGVKSGRKSRHEFGSLIQSTWDTEVFKNVTMSNRLSLYSDYLNNYGNIDINWELNFTLTVNKHIKANIGTHLIYDDDIKIKDDLNNDGVLETLGAKVQLKQLLGIGVLFSF